MKYFITGICGFIASSFVRNLLKSEKDVEICGIDNLSSGKLSFLDDVYDDPRLKFGIGDVKEKGFLTEMMNGADIVIHTSSNADISKAAVDPSIDFWNGTYLTHCVLEAMRINKIKKILYFSGSGIYGDKAGYQKLKEDYPFKFPISTYAASKLAGEALVCAYCHRFDMVGRVYRFANVVGPRQTHGVGQAFIQKLKDNPNELLVLGGGNQSKLYIYVDDIIDAVLKTKDGKEIFNYYNVATDDPITVNEIAKIVIQRMGLSNVKIKHTEGEVGWPGDIKIVRFDTSKIKSYGWRPKYNSREAIDKSISLMLKDWDRYYK